MDVVSEEFTTNYLSYLALAKAFLPFLQAENTESSLVYTGSALAIIPCPYPSKASADFPGNSSEGGTPPLDLFSSMAVWIK